VAIILDDETCASLLALMRINIKDLPAVFNTPTALSQMFFVAIGMIACSEDGRWALDTAWAGQVSELTGLCLRFQGLDPALQYVITITPTNASPDLTVVAFFSLRKAAQQ
jgi:hypothetical protein